MIKRAMDILVAGIGLVILSPLFLVLALLIRRDSKGPVFYKHERIGRSREPFGLYKFRTMRLEACRGEAYGGDNAEEEFAKLMDNPELREEFAANYKLQNDPRVTRFGAMLRRTSLDELPQLINIIRGEMSLVGPRPLTEGELERYYGVLADDLLQGRPGVTGYWQINGRSDLTYDDRVRLDLAYVGGWSLGLDMLILARTLRVVTSRRAAV
jgi:lipopolysaccharide/colanic/teichoic acid biosynthesis glycosyltransferase